MPNDDEKLAAGVEALYGRDWLQLASFSPTNPETKNAANPKIYSVSFEGD
jgi:hypothetical protein